MVLVCYLFLLKRPLPKVAWRREGLFLLKFDHSPLWRETKKETPGGPKSGIMNQRKDN